MEIIRQYIRELLEMELREDDPDEGEEVEEVSTLAGNSIRGYTLPLGMDGAGSREDQVRVISNAFGDAEEYEKTSIASTIRKKKKKE